jgi:hypothetical protein
MLADVAEDWTALDDGALENFLKGTGNEHGWRLEIGQQGDAWIAEYWAPSALGDEVIPMGDEAAILPDEVRLVQATGPDRRGAMLGLARWAAQRA